MIDISHSVNPLIPDHEVVRIATTFWKNQKKHGAQRLLSIAWVGARESERINTKFRGKQSPTNVLTFEYGIIGGARSSEIILCPYVIRKEAAAGLIPAETLSARLLIHGLFHSEGIHHDSLSTRLSMERQERALMDLCGYDDHAV